MNRDFRDYLVDLRRHAELATAIVAGRSREELGRDSVAVLALERAIEIIGEAAARLPTEVHDRYPDVPWREMIGMRNRLAHAYFGTDLGILHEVATRHLTALMPRLSEIVARETGDDRGE